MNKLPYRLFGVYAMAGIVFLGIATAIAQDAKKPSKVFYYKPSQFIELKLKDGDTVYINASSIESITSHRNAPGDSEVRTLTQEYHVQETVREIRNYIVEQ